MKLVRWILGRIILLLDWLFTPRSRQRSPEAQRQIEQQLPALKLYQYHACPFCVKVRRAMKRLNLPIETRDARRHPEYAEELRRGGGQLKVPCLRIEKDDGSMEWLYESSDIVAWLEQRFAAIH
ncbi:MAG TPA: glutaredoxin [Gammaproteobacteria bacterium]|nr:glutaredoxin [Gammaproteobacteria bacterium]